uniref:alkaline phosphatase n=1 Tax=Nilaparvata lugens TaxID=108931 RepID=A0A2L1IQ99_NILLU|nr:ALP-5 [Nilaparvata lugens]
MQLSIILLWLATFYGVFYCRCILCATYLGKQHWYEEAEKTLRRKLGPRSEMGRARNLVLIVGDGLSLTTLTAARILKGQRLGQPGEDTLLAWEAFPALALAKTYNLDAQVGESSACATALLCGVKANFETVGLDGGGRFEDCFSSYNSRVESLLSWAQQEGKSTGIVTNTRVTHATPAALFAHSPSRYWEDDSKVPANARKSCKDIARQLIEDEPGKHVNVLLGGGRRHWMPKMMKDVEQANEEGRRLDGRNLIEEWVRDKKRKGSHAEYVYTRAQLHRINPVSTQNLLGLFAYSHMDFEADRDTGPDGDPSLAEMTIAALSILQKNTRGFFLFVEGGRIDHAHHYNNPYRALDETLALEAALLAVLSLVDQTETLIVVTSDHSHVMTMGGLSTPRGNSILGTDRKASDVDGLPYTTLLYGNGPGYAIPRLIPSNVANVTAKSDKNTVHGSAAPRHWSTHGGEDVPVYASGPLASHLFTATIDQSFIPHAMAYSACIGPYKQRCQQANFSFAIPNCIEDPRRERTRQRGAGAGVVLASSVMSDDTTPSCTHITLSNFCTISMVYILWFAVT